MRWMLMAVSISLRSPLGQSSIFLSHRSIGPWGQEIRMTIILDYGMTTQMWQRRPGNVMLVELHPSKPRAWMPATLSFLPMATRTNLAQHKSSV
jgi:hypothetical protein